MGNGLASSPLVELATVVMEMTILPFVMSLWFHTRTLRGWLLVTIVLWYEYSLRFGANIGGENFLNLYAGTDYTDASLIFFTVLGSLSIIFALIGTFLGWVIELPDIMPYYALLPIPEIAKIRNKTPNINSNETGLHKYGLTNIPRPYLHCLVTTLLFLFTVATPHILYSFLQDNYGHHLNDRVLAFWVPCIFLVVGYLALFFYFYFFPDLYVFGISKRNVARIRAENVKGLDAIMNNPALLKEHQDMAWVRQVKTIFILIAFHVIPYLIMAAVRYAAQDVDWSWITAVVLGGIIFLIALVMAIIFFAYNNSSSVQYVLASCEVVDMNQHKKVRTTTTTKTEEIDDPANIIPVTNTTTTQVSSNYSPYAASSRFNDLQGVSAVFDF